MMKKITILVCFILCQAVLLFAQNETTQRKNVIVIVTDDQRYDALGVAGNDVVKTPNLDKLATDGTYFKNAFVATPICCASRANILTGQFSRTNGVPDFFNPIKLETTYPAILRDNGYYTGFIGKWGTMEEDEEYYQQSADLFDYWAGCMRQSNYWHERDCNYVVNNGTTDKHNFKCNCPPDARGVAGEGIRIGHANINDPVHQDTYVIPHKVDQFLESRDNDKPFCLSISFKAPHGPWSDYAYEYEKEYEGQKMPLLESVDMKDALNRPEFLRISLNGHQSSLNKIKTKNKLNGPLQKSIREYYRLITGMDQAVGDIMQKLKDNGLYDNTVIIFIGDNGQFLAEHGFSGKWLMYEESIRVPFIVFDPTHSKKNPISEEFVMNIDIAPTLLNIANIDVPETMEGKSFLPLLSDPKIEFRDAIFAEHHYGHGKKDKHIERSECLRTDEWKYINYINQTGSLAEELYNIKKDPLEMNDLSGSKKYKKVLEQLRTQYNNYWKK